VGSRETRGDTHRPGCLSLVMSLHQSNIKKATAICPPPSCSNRTVDQNKPVLYSLSSMWQSVCDGQLRAHHTQSVRFNLWVCVGPRASHVSGKVFNTEKNIPRQNKLCMFSQTDGLIPGKCFNLDTHLFFPVDLSTVLMRENTLVSLPFKRTAVL
jgi:hypothetical protein